MGKLGYAICVLGFLGCATAPLGETDETETGKPDTDVVEDTGQPDTDCQEDCPEICDDGVDNDDDGLMDCLDPDCTDVCEEDCSDEIDNDADALVDCDDPECDGLCPEDCLDGRDNDGDGLVDCEDADCIDEATCVEDCNDGEDNDRDGLTDCEDDECWGQECHPEGVQSTVTSGLLNITSVGTYMLRHERTCGPYASWDADFGGVAEGVKGTVRTKATGQSEWNTCDWSVDTVSIGSTMHYQSSTGTSRTLTPITRNNFQVEEGCQLDGSWFLPQDVRFIPPNPVGKPEAVYLEDRRVWFGGEVDDVESDWTLTADNDCLEMKQTWDREMKFKLTTGDAYRWQKAE